MEQIEAIKKKIASSKDLKTIVKNMKSLAAVYIRYLQEASRSMEKYRETVALGFKALFASPEFEHFLPVMKTGERMSFRPVKPGFILVGSEQGMCGGFNEKLMNFLESFMKNLGSRETAPRLTVAGSRIYQAAADSQYPVDRYVTLPQSPEQVAGLVDEMILHIENWRKKKDLNTIYVIHNQKGGNRLYEPVGIRIFPLDRNVLKKWSEEPWEGKTVPLITLDKKLIFRKLIDQYFYTVLFRAFITSLESENAARLASMEAAEKNISDKLNELNKLYNIRRQQSITSELLDMVGGFEALSR